MVGWFNAGRVSDAKNSLKMNWLFFFGKILRTKRMERNFEMGIVRQVFKLMYRDLVTMTRSNVEIVDSLENYIEEFTKNEDLEVDNFSKIFLFYFVFCFLILLTFLFNLSRKFIKRNAFRLRIWFRKMKTFVTFRCRFWRNWKVFNWTNNGLR